MGNANSSPSSAACVYGGSTPSVTNLTEEFTGAGAAVTRTVTVS
jgi:hypothetical protein